MVWFSNPSSGCVYIYIYIYIHESLSHVQLFATSWIAAHQVPLSIKFSRQEFWSRLPFPSSGDLPHQGLKLGLLHCRQILYHLSHQGSARAHVCVCVCVCVCVSECKRIESRDSKRYFCTHVELTLVMKSCLTLVTPWTVAHQAPLSMGFSRQEY